MPVKAFEFASVPSDKNLFCSHILLNELHFYQFTVKPEFDEVLRCFEFFNDIQNLALRDGEILYSFCIEINFIYKPLLFNWSKI
ncbi:hypothetical protein KUTeg_002694 [Tegillarca granosa]|uniref:Uncharacterized protein n=1 Tax=Tegillarca granosa TaxID=220873 RepID=A0ABQ9FWE5_TEGGR|nr:hypothetical protein KUTeg_002694 [Tegillarca granosa]